MKSFRRCWTVPADHASWVVVDASDLDPAEEPRVVRETFLEGRVAEWAREPSTCRALLEMYEAVVGSCRSRPPTRELIRTAVDVVQAAFRRGRLVAIEEPRVVQSAPSEEASSERPAERPAERSTPKPASDPAPKPGARIDWVRIVVEDQDGKPLPGVYVRLTLPDQTTEDHQSQEDGAIYTDQLTPGQCKVELPGLDKDSWSLKT